MPAPLAAAAVAGRAATAGRAGKAAAGAKKAATAGRHAAKPGRVTPRPGGARHAAKGQLGRDARQIRRARGGGDVALGFLAGRGGRPKPAEPSRSGPARALVAEFLICTVLLALSPLARKEGETSPVDWMKRGSAVAAVFILLGMVTSIGPRAGRTAAALGGLITVVLLVDQRSMFGVIAEKLGTAGTGGIPQVGPPDEDTVTVIEDPAPGINRNLGSAQAQSRRR